MYNKLFTKILDSSIWLEDAAVRLVWITLLAAMDEDGVCLFASEANLAHRARLPMPEVSAAVKCLESEDPHSSDPENGGRRIERIPGGWLVLNAGKYRELVTREAAKERTRLRVAKYRERQRGNAGVTPCNAGVTEAEAPTIAPAGDIFAGFTGGVKQNRFEEFWDLYPNKKGKGAALKAWIKADKHAEAIIAALRHQLAIKAFHPEKSYQPHPATWLNQQRWLDEATTHEKHRTNNPRNTRTNGQCGVGIGRYGTPTGGPAGMGR